MAEAAVASRYAQALFEIAKAEETLVQAVEELQLLRHAMVDLPELREFFLNPDVDPDQKIGVLERGVRGTWLGLTRAFIQVVIGMGRPESLPAIAEALQGLLDKEQRRLRVTVRSARPIPASLLARLQASLERHEDASVELTAEVVPGLLGGVQVLLDHRVIDGSVRRQLDELRQRLKTVQVA